MITPVMINCVVIAKQARGDGQFLATQYTNEAFFIETTMESFNTDDLLSPCTTVFDYISQMRSLNAIELELHYHIRVQNVNAPLPPAGALVQAKYQLDRHFGNEELLDSGPQDFVNCLIQDLTNAVTFTTKNPLATNTPLGAYGQPYGIPLQDF